MKIREELAKSVPFALRLLWVALILGPLSWIVIRTNSLGWVSGAEAASWVQAVGSIGAIIGAGAVANWQMQKSQSQSEKDKVERQQAMYAVIHNAAEWASSAGSFVSKTPEDWAFQISWNLHMGPSFSASLQSITKVPAHELGSPLLVTQFVTIVGGMETINRVVGGYMREPSSEPVAVYAHMEQQALIIKHAWSKFVAVSGYKDFRL
ncbi:hypothetical protein [uncultured Pseudomonas sp.]|uniref:hypothetical protein n=1 Tax=uncultured Pseudomonas sp. TaxID=114707 RepID=UPI0025CC6939|nr:hypothetical protein [uncultured Pseudomonas sp.]